MMCEQTEVYMRIGSVVNVIKALKPNQCYLIGGSLISTGLVGTASPYWFPLAEDVIRNSLNLVSRTDVYTSNNATLMLSGFCIALGLILIVLNRVLEYKELTNIPQNSPDNVFEFKAKESNSAFEADSSGIVTITGGKIKNYPKVAKATNGGVIKIDGAEIENEQV